MRNKWHQYVSQLFARRSRQPIAKAQLRRRMRGELLEDRRMLAKAADIVFLVDESNSGGAEFLWVADLVNRDGGLDDYLTDPARDIAPRYGLVGLGKAPSFPMGHSHLLDINDINGDGDKLFGTAAQFASVAEDTTMSGGGEEERGRESLVLSVDRLTITARVSQS
jgi:hypothetical protein